MDRQRLASHRLLRNPPPLIRPLLRAIRDLRWSRAAWSGHTDREYHDSVFARHLIEPFTFSYPGYVTIRRFADLAAEHFPSAGTVVDIGCGPGEITCELARRHPDVRLIGVDHSMSAIDRARSNAESLGLSNVTFVHADAERYASPEPVQLVLMFDSFHHLLEPSAFVKRVGAFATRVFLVEPVGNWLGQWTKGIDLDWLLIELNKIRARLELVVPPHLVEQPQQSLVASVAADQGAAVEHRYTLDDFARFFAGYGLRVRGTVAGFETYPPADPAAINPVREHLGRLTYELIVAVEEALTSRGLDLLAKHWAIYADQDLPSVPITLPHSIATGTVEASSETQGAHDIKYVAYHGPTSGTPGEILLASVEFENRSWRTWSSNGQTAPVFLSYHWADKAGNITVHEGLRTSLPRPVAPGDRCHASLRVQVPEQAGSCRLLIDLIEEGVTWFSGAGSPHLQVPFRVRQR